MRTDFWYEFTKKEMNAAAITFKFHNYVLVRYNKIICLLVFYIKMYFTINTWYLDEGNIIGLSDNVTVYDLLVWIDPVQISLLDAEMNGVYILACKTKN